MRKNSSLEKLLVAICSSDSTSCFASVAAFVSSYDCSQLQQT